MGRSGYWNLEMSMRKLARVKRVEMTQRVAQLPVQYLLNKI